MPTPIPSIIVSENFPVHNHPNIAPSVTLLPSRISSTSPSLPILGAPSLAQSLKPNDIFRPNFFPSSSPSVQPNVDGVHYSILSKLERIDSGEPPIHSTPIGYFIQQHTDGNVFVTEQTNHSSLPLVVWEKLINSDVDSSESRLYAKLQGDCNFVMKQTEPIKKTYWDSQTSQHPNRIACALVIFPEANPPRISVYKGPPPYSNREDELWWEPLQPPPLKPYVIPSTGPTSLTPIRDPTMNLSITTPQYLSLIPSSKPIATPSFSSFQPSVEQSSFPLIPTTAQHSLTDSLGMYKRAIKVGRSRTYSLFKEFVAQPTSPPVNDEILPDIPQTLATYESLTIFLTMLDNTGLIDDLAYPAGPFTVFAPTNDAFDEISSDLMECLSKSGNKAELSYILRYHLVNRKIVLSGLIDGMKIENSSGHLLKVDRDDNVVKINDGRIINAGISVSNGVVHIINSVLIPPGFDMSAFLATCDEDGGGKQ